jgi:hypothetical protein
MRPGADQPVRVNRNVLVAELGACHAPLRTRRSSLVVSHPRCSAIPTSCPGERGLGGRRHGMMPHGELREAEGHYLRRTLAIALVRAADHGVADDQPDEQEREAEFNDSPVGAVRTALAAR